MNSNPTHPRRIVVYRIGSLGDTLVVLPAFHLVREAFPDAHITLLTNFPMNAKAAPMEAVLMNMGLYDDTLRYPASVRNLGELRELRKSLRAGRYDCLVYLAKPKGGILTSIRDYVFFRSSGIPKVLGVPFSGRTLRCDPIPGSSLQKSETVRMMEALQFLGTVDLNDRKWWDMRFTPDELSGASAVFARHGITAPFLAAAIGTKKKTNDWEEPNWQELIRRLAAQHPGLPLVLFGVNEERERSERMLALWRGPKANLCGETSPRVSAAILRNAAAMVCHDSGPMHLAATVGVPCVAIFSARSKPGEWFPRGSDNSIFYQQVPCMGCDLSECVEKKKVCILSITVDQVYTAVMQHLAASGASSGNHTLAIS